MPLFHDLHWQRSAATVEGLDLVESELFNSRMIQKRDPKGWHCGHERRPVVAYGRQHQFRVVLWQQHLERADPNAGHHADCKRIDVKIRNDDEKSPFVSAPARI